MIKHIYAEEDKIYIPCHIQEDLLAIKEIVDCKHTVRMEEIEQLDYWIFEGQNKECFIKIFNIKDLTPNKVENKVIGRGIFIDILPLSLDTVSNAVETKFTINNFKQHCNTESMFEKTRPLIEILCYRLYLQEQNKYSAYNEIVELREQLERFTSIRRERDFSVSKKLEEIETDLLRNLKK